jgi:hypothetical protein
MIVKNRKYNIGKLFYILATGQWFSPLSSTNKTDHHDQTEIVLKVALNTITLTLALKQIQISGAQR